MCTLALRNGQYVTCVFGVDDDLKRRMMPCELRLCNGITVVKRWEQCAHLGATSDRLSLWTAAVFVPAPTMTAAFDAALRLLNANHDGCTRPTSLMSMAAAVDNCDHSSMIAHRRGHLAAV